MAIDSAKLKDKLGSDASYEILDKALGGTWLAGGCLLLARALNRLQPDGQIMVLFGITHAGEPPLPNHCVLLCDGLYIDANGIQSEEELLRYWHEEEDVRHPYLLPYDDCGPSGMETDEASEKILAQFLADVCL